jgi:hypothetical protein
MAILNEELKIELIWAKASIDDDPELEKLYDRYAEKFGQLPIFWRSAEAPKKLIKRALKEERTTIEICMENVPREEGVAI